MTREQATAIAHALQQEYLGRYTVDVRPEGEHFTVLILWPQERYATAIRRATDWHLAHAARAVARWQQ